MGIKFDKEPLAIEPNNYLTKIVNVYIVHDLDTWPRNPTNNFKLKNCLFGPTTIIKNGDKENWGYSCYEIHLIAEVSGFLIITMLEML